MEWLSSFLESTSEFGLDMSWGGVDETVTVAKLSGLSVNLILDHDHVVSFDILLQLCYFLYI